MFHRNPLFGNINLRTFIWAYSLIIYSITRALKLVSAIFYQNFIYSPNDSSFKTMKNIFHFIQKTLFVLEKICDFFPYFPNFVHWKGLATKEKIELTFLGLFDNPLLKYLIFKRISCRQWAVLGYLTKLKRGLGLAFGAHFLHDFSIKNVPF